MSPARSRRGRTYGSDGRLAFESHGACWELTVEEGRGRCAPSSRAPDLRFADTALASLFLGGERATQLARAELITGAGSAIAVADRMFASAIAPWCPEVF